MPGQPKLLYDGEDWSFDTIRRTYDALEEIALGDLGLEIYPNQIEIISSEQMLDAYSSIGMPLMYQHWSFGKHFLSHKELYQKGAQGIAYEIVINSNPCISYNMEENTMPLQTLVLAHAAFGHNHFFRNNHLFQQWTDADSILDYLEYARTYIAYCEEHYGVREVEQLLDAAHALMSNGVFRYHRPRTPSLREEKARQRERIEFEERTVNYLWQAIPSGLTSKKVDAELSERKRDLHLPEENMLYFLERYSPILASWQREILRIIRNIAQYFYPQKQTKVMNEGCACFNHYYLTNRLHEKGLITDGAMLEILHHHSNVLTQPDFNHPAYSGINPYALGFAMMQDIKRICQAPTDEDRAWFPDIAGDDDWRSIIKDVWANYRDESFILQFLSPAVMRKFHMFALNDVSARSYLRVTDIHDEAGFRNIRDVLASNYDVAASEPDIQITDVDLLGDRQLRLVSRTRRGTELDEKDRDAVLTHIERLWGYEVVIDEVIAD